MATKLSEIETKARDSLKESSAFFWTSDELVRYMNDGIKDLWRRISDTYQDHFHTIDTTHVTLPAGANKLAGIPSDVFTIRKLMPRDLTAWRIRFQPRGYDSWEFEEALARGTCSLYGADTIYYAVVNAGAPVAAPDIYVAPLVDTSLNLTLVYVPTIATKAASDDNPIPGESNLALAAWTIAFARVKERPDRSPDPNWLGVYKTEADKIIVAIDPRQTQEQQYAEGMYEGEG